jgi:hypothetical protein
VPSPLLAAPHRLKDACLRKIRGKTSFSNTPHCWQNKFAISGPLSNLFDLLIKDGHTVDMAARFAYCGNRLGKGEINPENERN